MGFPAAFVTHWWMTSDTNLLWRQQVPRARWPEYLYVHTILEVFKTHKIQVLVFAVQLSSIRILLILMSGESHNLSPQDTERGWKFLKKKVCATRGWGFGDHWDVAKKDGDFPPNAVSHPGFLWGKVPVWPPPRINLHSQCTPPLLQYWVTFGRPKVLKFLLFVTRGKYVPSLRPSKVSVRLAAISPDSRVARSVLHS
jgi:hypothetical protein